MNYYNEFDPKAAAWLRELIKQGHIPPGDVDERSIVEVRGTDLAKYTQCHFFAGIGGWSYALKLAGWDETHPVWTGSCPCQPFSAAGQQKGEADERHLWPELRRLIAECRPSVCFGEQVASKLGREWLAGVRTDLEGLAYAVGAADLCAAGAGAPHIRQRVYWVADARHERTGRASTPGQTEGGRAFGDVAGRNHSRRLADADGSDRDVQRSGQHGLVAEDSGVGGLGNTDAKRLAQQRGQPGISREKALADAWKTVERTGSPGFWSRFDVLQCTDGKARRVESGTFPLAHGVPARVGRLRGYGNAIVPQVAESFIRAYLEVSA